MLVNFRDIGGLPAGGRRVAFGRVMRAAAPDYADLATLEELARLGIRHVCDFRSDPERPPTASRGPCTVEIWLPNGGRAVGDPVVALARCTIDVATSEALVHEIYARIAFDQQEPFRLLFARLLDGQLPHLIHCASGKDRTGVFIALLLHALGASPATIAADFARSNEAVAQITDAFRSDPRHAPLVAAPAAVWAPLMRADVAALDTLYAALEAHFGTVDTFLAEALGVGPAERERLRELLLVNGKG